MHATHTRPYEKLIVWKEAHSLCLKIYGITQKFPSSERYELSSQMRRAAYSVPTNIAEGNSRRSNKDKSHFFLVAMASLEELHYQCMLSRDLQHLSQQSFNALDEHVQKVSYLLTKLRMAFQ